MTTYISILRGINVSGQKQIKMDALRKSFESLGFSNVETYIQSGNVIFSSKNAKTEELSRIISQKVEEDFGFKVPVIVITSDKLKKIIDTNPFLGNEDKGHSFLHVTFLSSKPGNYDSKTIEDKKQAGEKIVYTDNAIYLYCPNGYGKTKLTNNYLEKTLKVTATTRNWKTVNELLKIARQTT